MGDPLKLFDQRDIEAAALYAKRVVSDTADLYPVLVDDAGNLRVNMTVGTISLSSTESTINNAVGNPVNVSLVNTAVTVSNTVVTLGGGLVSATVSSVSITASSTVTGTVTTNVVGGNINISSATLGTVTVVGNVNVSSATLGTVTTSLSSTIVTVAPQAGTSFATTAVTITNGASNIISVNVATATLGTVTVALSSTVVTVQNQAVGFNVNVASATLGTVTTALSSTVVTAQISSTSSVVTVHVSPTASKVTVESALATFNTTARSVSFANSGVTVSIGRTLTGSTGSLTATNGAITFTPSNRIKVYAISLTTTSTSELICIYNSGGVANGLELWRATLQAPSGANAGLNLAVTPPAFLFQGRSGTAVSLSLNTATLVHYSISYWDEA